MPVWTRHTQAHFQNEIALPIQTVFGCYTIADTWKFLRAEVEAIEQERPIMRVEYSREYVGRLESETIFKILKGIVGLKTEGNSQ
ncbi:hypothetical protein [Moorena sp. SIO3H5]|uniref:hypothetical protein n=1 Tax=Moorena sp. SIO3H5 TaxID=2607834 RepID=UPI0013BE6A32|nr:hypothetical protein [Moorena sp. SIO3H5]NEO73642.1 hypothetical protein [Moorena sp. SIO3H5]